MSREGSTESTGKGVSEELETDLELDELKVLKNQYVIRVTTEEGLKDGLNLVLGDSNKRESYLGIGKKES